MGNVKSLDQHIAEVQERNPHAHTFKILRKLRRGEVSCFELECLECGNVWVAQMHGIKARGYRCRLCVSKTTGVSLRKSLFQWIREIVENNPEAKWMEFGELSWSEGRVRIETQCLRCGREWSPRPSNLINGTACLCVQRSSTLGEQLVAEALGILGFIEDRDFFPQKKFLDCRHIQPLPFDFYLPEHNCLIEYQGQQHYKPIEFFGGEDKFQETQIHDAIKKDWAEANGYLLLRIPYTVNRLDLIVKGLIERLNL